MEEASRLLLEACHQFRDAVADLRGPLERDVENAAARCWEIREKTVQVSIRAVFLRLNLGLKKYGEPWAIIDLENASHWRYGEKRVRS